MKAQEVVDLLNSALAADPVVLESLGQSSVPYAGPEYKYIVSLGMVSLLNRLFWNSPDGDLVAAKYADPPEENLLGFVVVKQSVVEKRGIQV